MKTKLGLVLFALLLLFAQATAHAVEKPIYAWGDNSYGQLGDGTTTVRNIPVQTSNLTGVVQVAGGQSHSLAVKTDGTVWAWGYNYSGQLGDGTTTERHTPVQVSGLKGVVQVSGGAFHSLALKSNGTVWAWGYNGYGQLGDGTTTNCSTPVQVSGLTGVVQVSAGRYHSLALKSNGTVWAWGDNAWGQLGDGSPTQRTTPVQVSGLTGVVQVSGGNAHSLALKSDGTVWAWGVNDLGQLGDGGTESYSLLPVQVSNLTGVVQVSGGGLHSLALKSDGTVWAWGYNWGALGDGTITERHTPVQTSNLTGISFIASGSNSFSSYALTRAPRLDVFAASGNFGQAIGLTARLRRRPNLDSLPGKIITFRIDGGSVGTGVTNLKGYAQFALRVSDTLAIGSHTLTADFAGDDDYPSSSATGTLTTLATNTTLSSVNLSGTIGQTQGLKVRLKRTSDLSGVVGQTVSFSVDGSVVGTATTDANGYATYAYAIPELSIGSHTVAATFNATSQYAASSSSGTLTVAKSNTKLPTDQITGSQSSSVNLTATLKRSTDGSRLVGRTVTFKVDGVIVGTATTDGSGVATFNYTLNLTIGTHKIVTSFAGDAFDNSSTGKASLIVTP